MSAFLVIVTFVFIAVGSFILLRAEYKDSDDRPIWIVISLLCFLIAVGCIGLLYVNALITAMGVAG
ncbi:hypothetical protein EniLVp02_0216 [Vibrio phage EniLVp02]